MFLKDIDDWIRTALFTAGTRIRERRAMIRRWHERRKEPRSGSPERRVLLDRRFSAYKRK